MKATVKDKLLFAQMILDGFERTTILFFHQNLTLMNNVETFSASYIAQNGAHMTSQGCRKHLKKLERQGYIIPVSSCMWTLARPILRDRDIAVMASVFGHEAIKHGTREYA